MPGERAEEARAVMIELFPEGFEEADHPDGVELVAYTDAGGEERLWQVFGPGKAENVEPGWAEAWKRFHEPVRIGPLWVGPPWSRPDSGAIPVVIEPGRAFGTGSHPTTRLCLEQLLELSPSSMVDLGCGSGVLAIAAAKLGFSPVVAFDLDPAAVEAARRNAATNGVPVEVRAADALADSLPAAGLAVANIALGPVEELIPRLATPLLVTSGYLVADRPRATGWRAAGRRQLDGWAADLFERL